MAKWTRMRSSASKRSRRKRRARGLRRLEVGLVNHLHHTHKVPISTACDTLDLSKATYYREGAPTAPAIQAPISPWWKTLIRARWMCGADSANPGYSVMLTYARPLNMKPLS